jgi:O-antigen ligase
MIYNLEKIIRFLLYFFVFILPFQIKYILISSEQNYNEIAIYFNYFILFFLLSFFFIYFYKIKKEKKKIIPKYLFIIAGLDFFVFISVLISPVFLVSIFKYILFLLSCSLFFFLLNFKYNLKKLLIFFVLGVFIQSSIGVWQFLSQSDFSNKYIGKALHDSSVLGTSVIETEGGRFLRSYGALDHPNILGALAFFSIIFLIYLFLKYDFNLKAKIAFYLVYFVNLLGLLFSFSRSSFLALFFSFFAISLGLVAKRNFKKFSFLLSFSLLFIIVFLSIFKPVFLSRLDIDSRLESISINERVEQADYSGQIIKNNIWFGVGLGAYHQSLLDENRNLKSYEAQPVHNSFLLILSEIGVWGFLFFSWFFFYFFRRNLSFSSYYITVSLFSGLFIFMIFDHWLWSLPFGMLFFFFILAVSSSISES